MKIGQLSAAPIMSEPVVTTFEAVWPMTRPPRPAMIAASKGRKTMSWSCKVMSAPHHVGVVDGDRTAAAEEDDEDREADGGLCSGDGQDEHGEDLSGQVAEEGAERDQVDVHGEQDEFDRHQH